MSWRKHRTLPPLPSPLLPSLALILQQVRSCGHPWPTDSPWEVQDELFPAPEGTVCAFQCALLGPSTGEGIQEESSSLSGEDKKVELVLDTF